MIARARQILREAGLGSLLTRGLALAYREGVRPHLPVLRRMSYAGIPTSVAARLGDRWVPRSWLPGDVCDLPEYEATLLHAIRQFVRTGDSVVVVGGGVGVTATVAALQTGPSGHVCVFEGGAAGVRNIGITARINGVRDRLSIEHAVVARDVHVYGWRKGRTIAPSDLPDCDVLELDCEGAEAEILRELVIRPRVVLVETHGLYGASTDLVVSLLDDLGYATRIAGLAEPRIPEICEAGDIRVVVAERSL